MWQQKCHKVWVTPQARSHSKAYRLSAFLTQTKKKQKVAQGSRATADYELRPTPERRRVDPKPTEGVDATNRFEGLEVEAMVKLEDEATPVPQTEKEYQTTKIKKSKNKCTEKSAIPWINQGRRGREVTHYQQGY